MRRVVVSTCLLPIFLIAFWMLVGSGQNHPSASSPIERTPPFLDAAEETGLIFRHENGMSGRWYPPEMMGPGVALFDFDNDGDLDIFLVQGKPLLPGQEGRPGARHRLFRNDLTVGADGQRALKFTDVTEQAGLQFSDYGVGVIAGDYDNDGWVDLYITCVGHNRLLHNNGNGTFTDVTAEAGVGGEGGWHTSASWVDFDKDGLLDLFVCQYLDWSFDNDIACLGPSGKRDYCNPMSYAPCRSHLYHNLGNGKFQDVSIPSRIASKSGAALGVVCLDVNGDGWPDIFVANDGMANHLWINQKNGTFVEDAVLRGCAVNGDGAPEANMGIIAADMRNCGLADLFVTHMMGERSTYFCNLGKGYFQDTTARFGLDAPTRQFTGFGTGALDFDNDGWLDIFAANGEIRVIPSQLAAGLAPPLRQRCQLFRNLGGSVPRFQEITDGDALHVEEVGRGAAFGDLDNDGDIDIVVANNNGPARVLINQVGQNKHWIGFRLLEPCAKGPLGNGQPAKYRDSFGAIATIYRSDLPPLSRRAGTDGSYLSSSDPRVLFGLGEKVDMERVVVQWPDGTREEWPGLVPNRYQDLKKGSGVSIRESSQASGK
jgi:hypothetical protein